MHTDTHSIKVIFGQARRHVVPLFQRPYVWTYDRQWEPLIEDLFRIAEGLIVGSDVRPHFMGAIVLEAVQQPTGQIDTRLIVDGQQRLTTLAILAEAFRDACAARGESRIERALQTLTRNEDPLNDEEVHRYKVWPTNADREVFRAVMQACGPDDLMSTLGRRPGKTSAGDARIADAYGFFYDEIGAWLDAEGEQARADRALNLTHALREKLRLVVIDLGHEDDPQAIFETLNARSTPLLPTDLVKNHLFRAAEGEGEDLDRLYQTYWRDFDAQQSWWRKDVGPGHAQRPRVDYFLGHYLTARRRTAVQASRLYDAFKDYADRTAFPAEHYLQDISRLAGIYKTFSRPESDLSQEGLFFQRLEAMEVSTAYPFLLHLFAEYREKPAEVRTILAYLESFLVRRMMCRLNTRGYNTLFVELISALENADASIPPSERVRHYLHAHEGDTARWPDDKEFRRAVVEDPVYGRVRRDRLQMFLEGIELWLRSHYSELVSFQADLHLEHIMPRKWRPHWPLEQTSPEAEEQRDWAVDKLGNITLVTGGLNASMSNASWPDKREALKDHSQLRLTGNLLNTAEWQDSWDERTIDQRGVWLFDQARRVWPFPG